MRQKKNVCLAAAKPVRVAASTIVFTSLLSGMVNMLEAFLFIIIFKRTVQK